MICFYEKTHGDRYRSFAETPTIRKFRKYVIERFFSFRKVYLSRLTLYNPSYFPPRKKNYFTLHSKSTKYGRPFSVRNIVNKIWSLLSKQSVFGKSMNKYLLTRGNYFGRTYGYKSYWKDKNAHCLTKKKFFCQNFHLFLDIPLELQLNAYSKFSNRKCPGKTGNLKLMSIIPVYFSCLFIICS